MFFKHWKHEWLSNLRQQQVNWDSNTLQPYAVKRSGPGLGRRPFGRDEDNMSYRSYFTWLNSTQLTCGGVWPVCMYICIYIYIIHWTSLIEGVLGEMSVCLGSPQPAVAELWQELSLETDGALEPSDPRRTLRTSELSLAHSRIQVAYN